MPTKYYERTTETLNSNNEKKFQINYKLLNVHICNQRICFKNIFILVKDMTQQIILETPFLT